MKLSTLLKSREFKVLALLVFLFIVSSYFSQRYAEELQSFRYLGGLGGALAYLLITIMDVLLAVASVMPLIPVAAVIWGPFWAGTLTVVGWTLGSMLAFWLARRYGERFICRFLKFCDISGYKNFMPRKRLFWLLVLARIFLPIDLISYAVGIFTPMGYLSFFFSTLIGLAVFSYLYAYGAGLPLSAQAIIGLIILAAIAIIFRQTRRKYWR